VEKREVRANPKPKHSNEILTTTRTEYQTCRYTGEAATAGGKGEKMKDDETKESTSDNVLNRVLLGDCVDLMSRMASGSVDFALTDPPYITSYRSRDGRSIANNDNADGCVRLSRKSTGC
jgi:hypothetical protein